MVNQFQSCIQFRLTFKQKTLIYINKSIFNYLITIIFMKKLILFTFSFIFFGTACKSTETRPDADTRFSVPNEPVTIQDRIEDDPSNAEQYQWIDESEYGNIWIIVDEFPSMVNGLREFQQRFSRTVHQNPSEDCKALEGERVLYNVVIDENGYISYINNSLDEPNSCLDLVEITIRATEYTPGTVNGKAVSTYFGIPLKF